MRRRDVIRGALGVTAGFMASACTAAPRAGSQAQAAPAGTASSSPSAVPTIQLTVSPPAGATDVSPGEPVAVSVIGGTLRSVTVTADGKAIDGVLDGDGRTWHSTGSAGYGQTCTVSASALDGGGSEVVKTSTFVTVKPSSVATVTFRANALAALKAGGTYGVGQPVVVAFSRSVTDKAAAQKAIVVGTSPAVEGKFFWLDDKTVHWRPAQYWIKGTTIDVTVNVLGVNLGKGVYGAANASTHFTIGRALVAVSDNNTHRTQVFIDGQPVRDMACSNGRGGSTTLPNGTKTQFWTHNGPHVVLERAETVSMSSASYGLTDKKNPYYYAPEDVHLCTRISYSGEYLHAAPWNHSLGKANLSHGCINLGHADAQWVYDTFMVGDIVEVKNSPTELQVWNGNGDWTVPYDRYGT